MMLILGQVSLSKGQESLGGLVPRRVRALWVQFQWNRLSSIQHPIDTYNTMKYFFVQQSNYFLLIIRFHICCDSFLNLLAHWIYLRVTKQRISNIQIISSILFVVNIITEFYRSVWSNHKIQREKNIGSKEENEVAGFFLFLQQLFAFFQPLWGTH